MGNYQPSVADANNAIMNQKNRNVNKRKLDAHRHASIIKIVDNLDDNEEDGKETFQATPDNELPKNRLIEKLCNGLTLFVQRMIKRESFYVTVKRMPNTKWTPAPRECATLTFVNYSAFLLGGLNYDVSKDIAQLNLTRMGDSDYEQEQNQPKWKNVEYTTNDLNLGRCRHTSVTYDDKIFSFGGCFMFNKKRMIRECSKEITIYNVALNSYQITRTKGV